MERSLFAFIWKYSKRDQILLLVVTLITFPFLYATLELPKQIINDAISADSTVIDAFGYELTQIQYLMALSFAYLGAVLAHGLLKMRLNTMKGVLAERMLRRFRYTLLARMMRFPKSYFQRTSQGELVSMITSEAEPMGGLMGDAVAQPLFQAGQMIIIMVFLFLQSVWFGLAGIALIPLQAWLIPILQRQINQLNKKRIIQIRSLASEIGETAAGMQDLRASGGWRYRRAQFTERLGRLFDIRFQIYQKKFFMKFLNNFITQLTPFFFYLVGGVLAIRGEISVGALVAALAAYKDLSAPWKELLTFYNQVQDMSLRWEIVTERFDPPDMIDKKLFEGFPETIPHLRGDISLRNVTVRGASGAAILEDITLDIPAGSNVAIKVTGQTERAALADVLTREVLPSRGQVFVSGQNLNDLHQAVIAARIGYAQSRPYFFDGTLGTNLLMPLRSHPPQSPERPAPGDRHRIEAYRSGNSTDDLNEDWTDPGIAEFVTDGDVRGWWFQLTKAMGIDEFMFRRMLTSFVDEKKHEKLVEQVIALRGEVWQAIEDKGLDDVVYRFDPDMFNPAVPLGSNLIFASPLRYISQEELMNERGFIAMVLRHGLGEQIIAISQTVIETLDQTFGKDGTEHPLFQALGIDDALYEKLTEIAERRRIKGDGALTEDEFTLLLTIPFLFTAEQIGPAFPESFKDEIVAIRKSHGAALREASKEFFSAIEPDSYFPRLTLIENLLYGRISAVAGARGEMVADVVAEVLEKHGMRQTVAETIWDVPTGIGGSNMPGVFLERAAFSRAAIKRPDILILDKVLASHDSASRERTRAELRNLMPETTLIFIEDEFGNPANYDIYIEVEDGRIDGVERKDLLDRGGPGTDDLQRKVRIIANSELFADLDPRNQRLLAFSAQWYRARKGKTVFRRGDAADAVYLCVRGKAELSFTEAKANVHVPITTVESGRVIGDLAVILNEERSVDMVALEDTVFLRIGAPEYLAVVQNDMQVAFSLLRTVAGHLSNTATLIRDSGIEIPRDFTTPPAGDAPADSKDDT
ncbi:cyclic nucleotide-binding domain-containing protein [Aliishimia ponticola]|uniref:Cyclic nucleotide-binding domain-containing protein n=1 Tax=Aliishimia ponticola TaxID=2499833 RepID=A0A4S4NCV6_9RHOB|nr:ABC transporter transmembrane domain-containing protein [Aliishimia ponticola]THH36585.1 cyclic nucleotide-binding domain-containing protein [Aliishimia ponticola]